MCGKIFAKYYLRCQPRKKIGSPVSSENNFFDLFKKFFFCLIFELIRSRSHLGKFLKWKDGVKVPRLGALSLFRHPAPFPGKRNSSWTFEKSSQNFDRQFEVLVELIHWNKFLQLLARLYTYLDPFANWTGTGPNHWDGSIRIERGWASWWLDSCTRKWFEHQHAIS